MKEPANIHMTNAQSTPADTPRRGKHHWLSRQKRRVPVNSTLGGMLHRHDCRFRHAAMLITRAP